MPTHALLAAALALLGMAQWAPVPRASDPRAPDSPAPEAQSSSTPAPAPATAIKAPAPAPVQEARDRLQWLPPEDGWETPPGESQALPIPLSSGALDAERILSPEVWEKGAPAGKFAKGSGQGIQALDWADVRFFADAEHLWIAARLAVPRGGVVADVSRAGGKIWRDHAFEVHVPVAAGADASLLINANGISQALGWPKDALPAKTFARCQDPHAEPAQWEAAFGIPWKNLGVPPSPGVRVPVQVRYLLSGDSGWTDWSASDDPARWPAVEIAGQGESQPDIRISRYFVPDSLPESGSGQVLIQAANAGNAPARLDVRLLDVRDRPVTLAQEIEEIAPGQSVEIPLRIPATSDAAHSVLLQASQLWGDPVLKRDLLTVRRLLTTRPPVDIQWDRERIYVNDAELTGRLLITEPEGTSLRSVGIELWDAMRRIAWGGTAKIIGTGVFPFRLDTQGLAPGDYRLVTTLDGRIFSSQALTILQEMALPERESISLKKDWPAAAGKAVAWPLYVGISFPGGTLSDPGHVRIVDASGTEIPAQFEILARWGPGGSIRWLGAHFMGTPQDEYHVEFGSQVQQAAHPPQPVTLTRTDQALLVDTGVTRFELPVDGPLISKIWSGETLVADNPEGCLVLMDQNGAVATEGHTPCSLEVEVEGPVQTIIKREGWLATPDGKKQGRFVVRMTFCAGLGIVPIQQTFVMTQSAESLQIKELALRMRPAMPSPWTAALDAGEPGKDTEWMTHEIAAGDEREFWMFQEVFPHYRQTGSTFRVGWGSDTLREGRVAGESAAVWSGAGTGLGVTIPHLAELFPKEVAVSSRGLTARLWSSRGGRALDYRATAIADIAGEEWLNASYPGGSQAFRKLSSNPVSTARTHDLVLWVLDSKEAPLQVARTLGETAAEQPFVCQDPIWLRKTLALGPLHPYDPAHFPRVEAFLQEFFTECLEGQARRFGDTGFLDYGSGPHTYIKTPSSNPGAEWPRLNYRYRMDYGMRSSIWLAYARSGGRAYRTYAEALNRHLYDFGFSHWESAGRPLGAELNGGGAEDNMLYWNGTPGRSPGVGGHQAFEVENNLRQFFLTGDRMARDVALRFGDYLLENFNPAVLPNVGATSSNYRGYGNVAVLYRQTWESRLARLLMEARRRVVDLRTTTGLVNQDYYGAFYKYRARGWGVLKDYEATGSPLAGDALLRLSRYIVTRQPPFTAGYQDQDSTFLQVGYGLSKDRRFPDWVNARLMGLAFTYTTPEGALRGNPYEGTHSSNVIEAIAYGLDLIAHAKDPLRPRPEFPLLDRAEDSWVAIQKTDDASPVMELLAGRGSDLNLLTLDNPARASWQSDWTGPFEVAWQPPSPTFLKPSLRAGYAEARFPLEMLGGVYRMDGLHGILSREGGKAVVVAPRGLYYAADQVHAAPLWFLVPAGQNGTLTVNRPATLHHAGQDTPLTPGTPFAIQGSPGADRASLTTDAGTIFVRVDGNLPPVFARNAEDLFLPPLPQPTPHEDIPPSPETAYRLGPASLQFPRGAPKAEGVFENFDTRQGTLEFWFRPSWSSALLAQPKASPILTTDNGSWMLALKADQAPSMLGNKPELLALAGSHLDWIVRPANPSKTTYQRILHPVDLWQDRWHHIALSWETDPKKGWVSELFVDGVPAMTWNRKGLMSRFQSGRRDEDLAAWKPAPPGEKFIMPGSLDGWVKQLRVSDIPRYRARFAPPAPESLSADSHTLLFLPLRGNATPQERPQN